MTARRYVITGKPGSGKTTWVNERAKPGDLVWDIDAVATTLFRLPRYPRPPECSGVLAAMRGRMFDVLRGFSGKVYVIETEEESALRIAKQINAEMVRLECSEEERLERLRHRAGSA